MFFLADGLLAMTSVPWVCALYFMKAFLFIFFYPTDIDREPAARFRLKRTPYVHNGNKNQTETPFVLPSFCFLSAASSLRPDSSVETWNRQSCETFRWTSGAINTQQRVTKEFQLISQIRKKNKLINGETSWARACSQVKIKPDALKRPSFESTAHFSGGSYFFCLVCTDLDSVRFTLKWEATTAAERIYAVI